MQTSSIYAPTLQTDAIEFSTLKVIESNINKEGPLLPILHDLQDTFGYIPRVAIKVISQQLHRTEADIDGVISFYHYFRLTPPAKVVVKICQAEACQAMGAVSLGNSIKEWLQTKDCSVKNAVEIEPIYCMGNCACAPNVCVGDDLYGRANIDSIQHTITQQYTAEGEADER
ncbi:NAD(P)H-dependent oxidoreductase subunit E [Photobacterium makurazakiensis]|uniref:NAD(P)H-dependent oxidoreductase subunit E n=1 Tax=Photobacterium makurazakiensis TaxID=2910234 RepID=UPI003D0E619B